MFSFSRFLSLWQPLSRGNNNKLTRNNSIIKKNYLSLSSLQGNRTTPSYVAFTDTERLIGDAAKSQVAMNPINTVFDAKRLIGRKFNDATIQADIKHWPFKVKPGVGDKPMIEGEFGDGFFPSRSLCCVCASGSLAFAPRAGA